MLLFFPYLLCKSLSIPIPVRKNVDVTARCGCTTYCAADSDRKQIGGSCRSCNPSGAKPWPKPDVRNIAAMVTPDGLAHTMPKSKLLVTEVCRVSFMHLNPDFLLWDFLHPGYHALSFFIIFLSYPLQALSSFRLYQNLPLFFKRPKRNILKSSREAPRLRPPLPHLPLPPVPVVVPPLIPRVVLPVALPPGPVMSHVVSHVPNDVPNVAFSKSAGLKLPAPQNVEKIGPVGTSGICLDEKPVEVEQKVCPWHRHGKCCAVFFQKGLAIATCDHFFSQHRWVVVMPFFSGEWVARRRTEKSSVLVKF